jgi:hypothetical protein
VFIGAGIWGLAVLTPLYWLVDISGRHYGAPSEYPHFFYGFIGVALAWQVAFLLIGSDPLRFRALMIPGIIEKFGYVTTLIVLYSLGRISMIDAQAAVPDGLIGILFVAAFVTTGSRSGRTTRNDINTESRRHGT